jgi:predicted RecB family nuclease
MSADDPTSAASGEPEAEEGDLPRLSPSSLYNLLKPSRCDLREWLKSHDYQEEPPGPFRELLFGMGIEHERRHLKRFGAAIDIAELPRGEQTEATATELGAGERVIYQGALRTRTTLAGTEVEVVGHPDFMLPARSGYAIRDSKLNRSVSDYIRMQLLTYGWLYEQTAGEPPVALQVHSGSGEILDVPYEGVEEALALLERMLELRLAQRRPVEHVGASKCSGCGFREHCWPQAIERKEVGLLPGVDRGTIEQLHAEGTATIDQLLERFDEESLAAFERPRGDGMRPIGAGAASILNKAEAHQRGEPILLQKPDLPEAETWVMFDLEGIPPRLDYQERIYMWGLQCFGEDSGPFRPALAGFGADGDREGWHSFLAECEAIFTEHGEIPFVHWATYERTKIDLYVSRYGDPNGTAARVKDNLLDLLPITRASVAVPLSSYSLKDIETLTGYERQLDEYGGDWSMAKYIEATDSADQAKRTAIMDEVLAYNREDLEATWAVLEWLRSLDAAAADDATGRPANHA